MALTDKLAFSDATTYQASFDAVAAGTATWAQAKEVEAVMNGLDYLRTIGNASGVMVDARTNLIANVPEAAQAAVIAAIDTAEPKLPRIVYDADLKQIGTPDEIAAAKAAQQAPAT